MIGIILIGLVSHACALWRLSIYFFLFKAAENPRVFYLNKATEYPVGYFYLSSKCSKLGLAEEIPVENHSSEHKEAGRAGLTTTLTRRGRQTGDSKHSVLDNW